MGCLLAGMRPYLIQQLRSRFGHVAFHLIPQFVGFLVIGTGRSGQERHFRNPGLHHAACLGSDSHGSRLSLVGSQVSQTNRLSLSLLFILGTSKANFPSIGNFS